VKHSLNFSVVAFIALGTACGPDDVGSEVNDSRQQPNAPTIAGSGAEEGTSSAEDALLSLNWTPFTCNVPLNGTHFYRTGRTIELNSRLTPAWGPDRKGVPGIGLVRPGTAQGTLLVSSFGYTKVHITQGGFVRFVVACTAAPNHGFLRVDYH
jgi:hypothetical protein